MQFGIQSIEHFFARAAKGAVTSGKAIISAANNPKVQTDVKTVEAISGLVSPQAAAIEDAAYQSFGVLAKACTDASHPTNPDGTISVTFGASVIADVKALMGSVENFAAITGMTKPATPAAPAAAGKS
jgi:hypothetical protein